MSIKMTLIPTERLNTLRRRIEPEPKSNMPPDVELKLLRQEKYRKKRRVSSASIVTAPTVEFKDKEKERVNMLMEHIRENKDRINIDKKTREVTFDNKISTGSDANQLIKKLVSSQSSPRSVPGWEDFKNALQLTKASAAIYGKKWSRKRPYQDWSKV